MEPPWTSSLTFRFQVAVYSKSLHHMYISNYTYIYMCVCIYLFTKYKQLFLIFTYSLHRILWIHSGPDQIVSLGFKSSYRSASSFVASRDCYEPRAWKECKVWKMDRNPNCPIFKPENPYCLVVRIQFRQSWIPAMMVPNQKERTVRPCRFHRAPWHFKMQINTCHICSWILFQLLHTHIRFWRFLGQRNMFALHLLVRFADIYICTGGFGN